MVTTVLVALDRASLDALAGRGALQVVVGDLLRQDADDHPAIARLTRVALLPEVLLRQLVDVLLGALLAELCAALDPDVLIWVLAAHDRDRDPRISLHATRLHAALERVDEDVFPVPVDPDRRDLRRSVAIEHGEAPEVLAEQERDLLVVQLHHGRIKPNRNPSPIHDGCVSE